MSQKIKLNNGIQIPIIGLGTWQAKSGEVTQAVKDAIDIGYRHIDGAHVYLNEEDVGRAVNDKIKEGIIKRSDIFLTSKLWNTSHRPELVEPAIRTTLKNLNVEYLDLYLMHWPFAFKEGDEIFPMENGKIVFSDVDYVETYKAMENLVRKGLTKSIGISNFNHEQIERLLSVAEIVPVTNQVECHPYLNQKKLMDYCSSKGITITAYSPLGCPTRPTIRPGEAPDILLQDPKIVEIAKRHGKTSAQVLIRYQVERGVIVIPKSAKKERIRENFEVFDFKLSEDDMKTLESMDRGRQGRLMEWTEVREAKYFPHNAEF